LVTVVRSGAATVRLRVLPAAVHDRLVAIAVFVIAFWAAMAVLAPVIAPHALTQNLSAVLLPPSPQHWFGTDELGRDVLSRVLWGARLSLPLGLLVAGLALVVGGALGAFAGFSGGWVDEVIMRVTDLFFAFPSIILAMAVTAALGAGLQNAVLAVVVVSWPMYARVVRGLVRDVGRSDYVVTSRLAGFGFLHIVVREIIPNVAGPVLALATVNIGTNILILAGLSFLGLGAQAPTPEWGSMVADGSQYFNDWWLSLFPGLAILTVVFACNVIGDRVRDALDPSESWVRG
jgi:peptide/nickel transport system permease protein